MKKYLFLVAIGFITAAGASTADAEVFRTKGAFAQWSKCEDWVVYSENTVDWTDPCRCGLTVPGANDVAIVLPGHELLVDKSESVGTLIIRFGGKVVVSKTKTLTIAGIIGGTRGGLQCDGLLDLTDPPGGGTLDLIGGAAEQIVHGDIFLGDNASTLQISTNVTLVGGGRIVGENESATIQIKPGVTFTSRISIEGALTVIRAGEGTTPIFVNDGRVHANRNAAPFIIKFDNLEVRGQGEFKAGPNHPANELWFFTNVTATGLHANFRIIDAILDIDNAFATSGNLHLEENDAVVECDPGLGEHCIFGGGS